MNERHDFHLRQHGEGILLPVRAQPKSRRREIRLHEDGTLKVCVTEPPEKGKANKAIRSLLAEALGVAPSRVQLLSGETSTQKRFVIYDLSLEEAAARLRRTLSTR